MKIALYGRTVTDANRIGMETLLNMLRQRSTPQLFCYSAFYDCLCGAGIALPDATLFASADELPDDVRLLISLGGDGTYLEAITLVCGRDIPVAGVNFGRMGFLTNATEHFVDLLDGNYNIQFRTLLNMRCSVMPADFHPYALNEITLQRTSASMLEVNVKLNNTMLPTYWADGLLVATATGTTAYSLSLGGPVVLPESNVLIISPIAPHNLNVRPLIVPGDSQIEMTFNSRGGSALVTADNRSFEAPNGVAISLSKAPFALKCASVKNNFIDALREKLMWGEDKRNKF